MLTKAYNGTEFMLYPNELIIVNRKHRAVKTEKYTKKNFCIFGSRKDIYGNCCEDCMIVTAAE